MAVLFEASTNAVKEAQDQELLDFTARRLREMAADIIMCHLLIQDASKAADLFSKSAHVYLNFAEAEVTSIPTLSKTWIKKTLLSTKSNPKRVTNDKSIPSNEADAFFVLFFPKGTY